MTIPSSLFITGTDTGVGKTHVTARLLRTLRAEGRDVVGMKPLACGDREDAEALYRACDGTVALNDINPVWLRAPAAPYAAAMIEGRSIDLELIRETFQKLRTSHEGILVEGVGGWRVPITRDYFVSDLAREFQLPVAIVVANQLGALNHAFLTIEAVRQSGLPYAGIILNHVAAHADDVASVTNRGILEDLAGFPVLAEFAYEPGGT
jgi:dethiobiotin synthetase